MFIPNCAFYITLPENTLSAAIFGALTESLPSPDI
jgi:hypothetical protein